jgi:hypothetical protein
MLLWIPEPGFIHTSMFQRRLALSHQPLTRTDDGLLAWQIRILQRLSKFSYPFADQPMAWVAYYYYYYYLVVVGVVRFGLYMLTQVPNPPAA